MGQLPTILISILMLVLVGFLVLVVLYVKYGFILLDKQIKTSILPHSLALSPSDQSLIELAIEIWRLEKRTRKVSEKLTEDDNKAFQNSIFKFNRYLEKNDINVIDYTGKKYNDGLNLDVINIEKDPNLSKSIIKETHEPAVMCKGVLIKKAKVIVHEK